MKIERDPFQRPIAFAMALGETSIPALPDASDFTLPPNLGAMTDTEPEASVRAVVLRAVIVGDTPKALVQVGAKTILAGIGSRIGSATVVGIDVHGANLSDGTSLHFGNARP